MKIVKTTFLRYIYFKTNGPISCWDYVRKRLTGIRLDSQYGKQKSTSLTLFFIFYLSASFSNFATTMQFSREFFFTFCIINKKKKIRKTGDDIFIFRIYAPTDTRVSYTCRLLCSSKLYSFEVLFLGVPQTKLYIPFWSGFDDGRLIILLRLSLYIRIRCVRLLYRFHFPIIIIQRNNRNARTGKMGSKVYGIFEYRNVQKNKNKN